MKYIFFRPLSISWLVVLAFLTLGSAENIQASTSINIVPLYPVNCFDGDAHRGVNSLTERTVSEDETYLILSFVASVRNCDTVNGKLTESIRTPFFKNPKYITGLSPAEGVLFEAEKTIFTSPFTQATGEAWKIRFYFPKSEIQNSGGRKKYNFDYFFSRNWYYMWKIFIESDGSQYRVNILAR